MRSFSLSLLVVVAGIAFGLYIVAHHLTTISLAAAPPLSATGPTLALIVVPLFFIHLPANLIINKRLDVGFMSEQLVLALFGYVIASVTCIVLLVVVGLIGGVLILLGVVEPVSQNSIAPTFLWSLIAVGGLIQFAMQCVVYHPSLRK